ncbi:MAG: hypothetical protein ABSE73_09305 [Planctomycetota bacterium]
MAREPRTGIKWDERAAAALNGQANVELRHVAPLETRRRFGAFFTGTGLSERLLAHCGLPAQMSVFYDPSCGMGDLLLAAAQKLPLGATLADTLRLWGRQLAGTDLHREFVLGAKSRLVLLARQRHRADAPASVSFDGCFPDIRVADGLKQRVAYERATHLLLNPPFGLVDAPVDCEWAGGRITEAATFVVTALERAQSGTEMLAILPDVLRSGSFSERWRNRVSELAEVRLVKPYGIFDNSADVDVFILCLVRRRLGQGSGTVHQWPVPSARRRMTIADHFEVHVGRVVPHRDPKAGPRHVYIHPRCVPTWIVMTEFRESRRHEGGAYVPPFVAIRRTSRPGDRYRATATVVSGKRPVAVENHLIVCQPKDGELSSCKELMKRLKTESVNRHLDSRIRCRHLTVGAVESVPLKPE